MAVSLKRESLIDNWGQIVDHGAGRAKWVLDTTEQYIKEANMPNVTCGQTEVTTGMFGTRRPFLLADHRALTEYHILIYARDFGTQLDAGWFLTVQPQGLKRALSKKMTGDPLALSRMLDIFSQQDLHAFSTITLECLRQTLEDLYEELKLDPSILNKQSRGYLNAW